jgi:hypothetical protein
MRKREPSIGEEEAHTRKHNPAQERERENEVTERAKAAPRTQTQAERTAIPPEPTISMRLVCATSDSPKTTNEIKSRTSRMPTWKEVPVKQEEKGTPSRLSWEKGANKVVLWVLN